MREAREALVHQVDKLGYVGHTTQVLPEGVLLWGPDPHFIPEEEVDMEEAFDMLMEAAVDNKWTYVDWHEWRTE